MCNISWKRGSWNIWRCAVYTSVPIVIGFACGIEKSASTSRQKCLNADSLRLICRIDRSRSRIWCLPAVWKGGSPGHSYVWRQATDKLEIWASSVISFLSWRTVREILMMSSLNRLGRPWKLREIDSSNYTHTDFRSGKFEHSFPAFLLAAINGEMKRGVKQRNEQHAREQSELRS